MKSTDDVLAIRARAVSKAFGPAKALDDFNLDVWEGSIIALLGPSGCGKTTALRVIAGFETPDRGTIEIHGRTVAGPTAMVPPEKRKIGMVFQDYALFPHLDVARNVGYGIDNDRSRLKEVLELVGLTGTEDRYPHELSGGQQQRVALARALAPRPDVILLDEPFSNLDAALRRRVRADVRAILAEANATAVLVTHDQEEALSIADVVAVMREGRVVQAAPPIELYTHPIDPWVAAFLGDAEFLSGTADGGSVHTELGSFESQFAGPALVMIRPEAIRLKIDSGSAMVVEERVFFGHDQLVTVLLPSGERLRSRSGPSVQLAPGTRVSVEIDSGIAFPA